jgi:hypothetical protein
MSHFDRYTLDFNPLVCFTLRKTYQAINSYSSSSTGKGTGDKLTYLDIKLDMIRVYFENRMAKCLSEDFYDDKLGSHIFQLNCKGNPTTVHVSREFIDENSPAEILTTLMRLHPESYIHGLKTGQINITNDGIKVQRSEI